MASFFGEIVPALSRAVDEEDDDDELEYVPKCSVSFKWNNDMKVKFQKNNLNCSTLVVAVGHAASAFMQVYMLNGKSTEVLGEAALKTTDDEDHDDLVMMGQSTGSSPLNPCSMHVLSNKPDAILMQCKDEVLAELTHSLVEQCFSKLNLTKCQVFVLTSATVSQFRSEEIGDDLQVPFLRLLKNGFDSTECVCPYLEQPNTVPGLSAQVLTFCQLNSIPCSLYIAYTDLIHPDERTVNKFKELERILKFKELVSINSGAVEQLSHLLTSKTKENTLYL